MLHSKFRGNRPAGSGEEEFLKGYYHIWAWGPSWSCDLDHLYKFWFPLHIKFGFDWPSGLGGEDL